MRESCERISLVEIPALWVLILQPLVSRLILFHNLSCLSVLDHRTTIRQANKIETIYIRQTLFKSVSGPARTNPRWVLRHLPVHNSMMNYKSSWKLASYMGATINRLICFIRSKVTARVFNNWPASVDLNHGTTRHTRLKAREVRFWCPSRRST